MSIEIQENKSKRLKTIFLLGAGASKPAGIPTIKDMTEEFMEHPLLEPDKKHFLESEKAYRRKFSFIAEIARTVFPRDDIEYMMSVLISLRENNETGKLIRQEYRWSRLDKLTKEINKGKQSAYYHYDEKELLIDLQTILEQFIRKKCETIENIDFLRPFMGLIDSKPLKIFTLNYDAIFEIFCENQGLRYTDGVNPYWDEKDFEKENEVNLFKLHGSLYWLRTKNNRIFKVPIKGLKISNVKFVTDEPVYEMMIYPAINKNKQLATYSWLSQKFRDELNNSELCIIIGYSFRDEDIKNFILEALSINRKLWLLIIDPNATQIKQNNFQQSPEFVFRIISLNEGIEEAVTNRTLHLKLQHIETARRLEDDAHRIQDRTQNRLDSTYWNNVIHNYLRVDHHDRIRMIVEDLRTQPFEGISGSFPETLEGILLPTSLKYALHYRNRDNAKFEFWQKFFIESCIAFEYSFFERHSSELITKYNPVTEDMLPSWLEPNSSRSHLDPNRIRRDLESLDNIIPSEIKSSFNKIKRSFHVLDEREPLSSGGYRVNSPEEIIEKYKNENLGISKWALNLNFKS